MVGLAMLLAALAAAPSFDERAPRPASPVILITIDGVRTEEVFRGLDRRLAGEAAPDEGPIDLLPRLRARAARQGFLAGDPDLDDPFLVRNGSACSLPGYQTILAGRDLGCADNHCGRVQVETVLERARRELGLAASEVAVFASWPEIALAAEEVEGHLTVNVGYQPFRPAWAPPDEPTEAILAEEPGDRPPWPYRRDRTTWALALRYLERFRPRVLYVGLGDPDEWAHLGDYPAYAGAVAALDDRLEALFGQLEAMGDYGAGASVLVTTDHGRGAGDAWTDHGQAVQGSAQAWLFATTPATRAAPGPLGRGRSDQLSIRPTIEALLGLEPCAACQAPIAELLPPDPERPEAVPVRPRFAGAPGAGWGDGRP